ncbi:Nuclease SbcCD subunit D [termite gut metagenome]|uniref:Nuclease SbcCD subunit D n=1 Tax=termite gut metagenome TaxID=433724 RepID=A0A5J4RET2_9ZZZZ
MKLLHTADWHLGQIFFEYDRKPEHIQFLEWLKTHIHHLSVDVLLVAGDVFDSPNPSAESQRLFYKFLRETVNENPQLQIVIIAGNHDAAARLEAPNPLLEGMNITVRGIVKHTAEGDIDINHFIIPLMTGGEIKAYCLAVPYLRQGDHPEAGSYAQGVKKMYEILYQKVTDTGKPIIAMGHLQATGAEISENDRSERAVIGGLECISPDSFAEGIAYTALGHLHRSQQVSKRENVRYSGAPIPMSFAEKNNKHGVVYVEITENNTFINHIVFEAPAKLVCIHKPLAEIFTEMETLPDGEVTAASPYLEIKVMITEPEPTLRHQIEEALRNKSVRLTRIESFVPKREEDDDTGTISYEEFQKINPVNIALDIFKKRFGGETMPDKMRELLQSVVREEEKV